mgnify:FL=1
MNNQQLHPSVLIRFRTQKPVPVFHFLNSYFGEVCSRRDFAVPESGTIQTNTGSVVPLKVEYKRNINLLVVYTH